MAVGIILGIVIPLIAIGVGVLAGRCFYNDNKVGGTISVIACIALVIAFIVVPFSFHTVQSGEVAVVKHLGKVNDDEVTAGVRYDFWITNSYIKYDTKVQTVDLAFSAYSADAQTMDVAMTLQYQIIPDKASDIAIQYGSLETLQSRITSIATEKTKSELSVDKAMDIIANRAQMSPRVEDKIKNAIGDNYYVNVVAVVLTDITFTDAFESAVENKMIAEQNQLKAEYENQAKINAAEADKQATIKNQEAKAEADKIAAQAKVEIAKSDAEAKKTAAQAEADAILIKANAEAEALNVQTVEVAKMLGLAVEVKDDNGNVIGYKVKDDIIESEAQSIADYIEYIKYMETWDGKLPDTVVGDNAGVILPTN